nr:hypothetical protein [Tanacetum cinerariifolium]
RAAVRAEIEVLRNERLAYEQEGIQTREALARSEAHYRALEARVAVLETHACRLEWQHQAADDFAIEHIMPSAVRLGIYLAYIPYEEEFKYLAFILAILVPVIVLAIGVDLCLKN